MKQQGRPVSWSPSSIWELLRRPLYRGEIVWNKSRKCDAWGIKHQRPRAIDEWITTAAPELRIVSEAIWSAVHDRLAGAREDYSRRNAGRVWGRPVNGTDSPYLLTGLAQCGICGGGLFMQTRQHGGRRARFYACSSHHQRGRQICANNQVWPMELIDGEVLEAFREDLLNPVVLDRALAKLRTRLTESPSRHAEQVARLNAERERLERELFRLSAALAEGAALPSVLSAIRERETRQAAIAEELTACKSSSNALAELTDAVPEAQRRLKEWRSVLTEETGQARQMLRALLEGRIVFTPRPEVPAVDFAGRGNYGRLFAGLIASRALASPAGDVRFSLPEIRRSLRVAA